MARLQNLNHKTKAKTNRRQQNTLPLFLFLSDGERLKDPTSIVERLPMQCGVVLRDYENPDRLKLIQNITKKTQNRNLVMFLANSGGEKPNKHHNEPRSNNEHWPNTAKGGQRKRSRGQLITTSAHNMGELGRANRLNVNAVLISPVFATSSHPDKKPLNIHRFVRLARLAKTHVYALGGISEKSINHLKKCNFSGGFAGISLFK
jgi:thiamine-phosphate pyrophosphorylase